MQIKTVIVGPQCLHSAPNRLLFDDDDVDEVDVDDVD